jgi:hypothetical protein
MNNFESQPEGFQQHTRMKQTNMNRIRSWCGMLLAGLLLAGFAPAAHAGLFTGPFATTDWTQTTVANDGVFAFTGTGTSTTLVLKSSTTTGYSDTLVSALNSGTAELISFDWTLTANGNIGSPTAYLYVGDVQYLLQGPSGNWTGINVPANTDIYFELVGDTSTGKSPAELEIVGVPEAGNALAGLLVLGAVGFEWFRRKHMAVG